MSIENPIIKFSPFEALLIGEKNKIVKRKPMKNTIFITQVTQKKKTFDLRALFDLKEEIRGKKKHEHKCKVSNFMTNKEIHNREKIKSSKTKKEVYCYEYEGHKVYVKDNKLVKFHVKNKKIQSNKVKFKPEFKFKETLEERIIHKIQKRKKILKPKIVRNGKIVQLNLNQKRPQQRHSLRGKDGKFISKDNIENKVRNQFSSNSKCIPNSIHVKKSSNVLSSEIEMAKEITEDIKQLFTAGTVNDIQMIHNSLDVNMPVSNGFSNSYCADSEDFLFPALCVKLEQIDFDDDNNLMDILFECHPKTLRFAGKEDFDDFSDALKSAEIVHPSKSLKRYERKKTVCDGDAIREVFSKSTKENHCISLNINKLENIYKKSTFKRRRNGINHLIDERPTKDNHLIPCNKIRSPFSKTACGSETYLENFIKPVLLNSPFGRLPDIS